VASEGLLFPGFLDLHGRRPADAALVWEPARLRVLALFSPPRTSSSLSSIEPARSSAVRSAQDDYHAARAPAHRCDIIENRNDSWRFKRSKTITRSPCSRHLHNSDLLRRRERHRQDSSQSRSKLKPTNRLTDELACFGAIRAARAAAICTSTNRTLIVFSPYFAISKPAQQLGLVSKFPLL
jgi:hypothetical protein